ncbi:MAG: hypothetical protein HN368_09325 [Spirochaetales bacterium]|jgi:hypothetical protein|nr:hypothetical protein [Spirochaetales bacterium]
MQVNFLAESFAGNVLQVICGKKIGTEDEIVILKREVDDVEVIRGLIRHDVAGFDDFIDE